MYVNLLFVLAAVLALVGTNRQADLARRKLTMQFGRENRLLPEAVRRKPSIGWLPTKARRRWRAAVESLVGEDASRWRRYQELLDELRAWEFLESSVGVGFVAALGSIAS
jgi:hypothetical protein